MIGLVFLLFPFCSGLSKWPKALKLEKPVSPKTHAFMPVMGKEEVERKAGRKSECGWLDCKKECGVPRRYCYKN